MDTIVSAKRGNYAATNTDDAFRILFKNKYQTCIIYDIEDDTVSDIINSVLNKLKEYNTTIPNINDQMLPSVYRWIAEGDHGNSCYYAAEISIGRFEDKAQMLHIFNEPLYWVLTDPTARKPLSIKAMNTMAMIGYMMTKEK